MSKISKEEKELERRKAVGDHAYYKNKLENDRTTLKLLRILGIMLGIFSVIIIAISIAVQQYNFTIGWSVGAVVCFAIGIFEWKLIAKRREEYLEAYNKNEITKQTKKQPKKQEVDKNVKVIKPKR